MVQNNWKHPWSVIRVVCTIHELSIPHVQCCPCHIIFATAEEKSKQNPAIHGGQGRNVRHRIPTGMLSATSMPQQHTTLGLSKSHLASPAGAFCITIPQVLHSRCQKGGWWGSLLHFQSPCLSLIENLSWSGGQRVPRDFWAWAQKPAVRPWHVLGPATCVFHVLLFKMQNNPFSQCTERINTGHWALILGTRTM